MKRRIAAFWVAFAIVAAAGVAGSVAYNSAPAHLPPCPTEDSSNCYFDASTRGDGVGRSFIDWHGTTYLEGESHGTR